MWWRVVVGAVVGLVVGVAVAHWLRPATPRRADPVRDTLIVTQPAQSERTAQLVQAVDTLRRQAAAHVQHEAAWRARAAALDDSLQTLLAHDSAAPIPRQAAAVSCEQRYTLRTRQVEAQQHALTACDSARLALDTASLHARARLAVVQSRSDSLARALKREIDTPRPCRRDWGLFTVPCVVQDVAEIVGTVIVVRR